MSEPNILSLGGKVELYTDSDGHCHFVEGLTELQARCVVGLIEAAHREGQYAKTFELKKALNIFSTAAGLR